MSSSPLTPAALSAATAEAVPSRVSGWRIAAVCVLAALWAYWAYVPFPGARLPDFGYTPVFMSTARTSLEHGGYSTTLGGMTNHLYQGPAADTVVPDVQREPLYPALLMLCLKMGVEPARLVVLQVATFAAGLLAVGLAATRRFGLAAAGVFFLLMMLSDVPRLYCSVLYPYAIHVAALLMSVVCLERAIVGRGAGWLTASGLLLAVANFERGTYLLLPWLLAVAVYVLLRRQERAWKYPLILLAASFLPLAPWLIRNASHGVWGMNQMSGYSLGYTFGQLYGGDGSAFQKSFDQTLDRLGPEGTQVFTAEEMVATGRSFAVVDKAITRLALRKMWTKAGETWVIWLQNAYCFPGRLLNISRRVPPREALAGSPWEFFHERAERATATPWEGLLVLLGCAGLAHGVWRRRPLAVGAAVVVVYAALVAILPVRLDPRYRGPAEALLLLYAAVAIVGPVRHAAACWRRRGKGAAA